VTRPEEPKPLAAVIVTCTDDGRGLQEVLGVLRGIACAEVLVVDDGSCEHDTLAVLDTLERDGTALARQDGGVISRARNLGVRLTHAPFVLHLDTRAIPVNGFIEQAVALMQADPTVGVVYADGRHRSTGERIHVIDHDPTLLITGNQIGTFALIRRSALEKAGGWDELFTVDAEWELWLALTEAGWGFSKLGSVGFELLDHRVSEEPTTTDPAIRVEMAVAIAEKHQGFYAHHLLSLIANYQTALATQVAGEKPADPEHPGPWQQLERDRRDHADQLAEVRAALAVAQGDAVRARSRISEVEADRFAAQAALATTTARLEELGRVEAERNAAQAALAEAHSQLRALREEAHTWWGRSAELEELLAAHQRTRSYRWLRLPRRAYGALHARRR